MTCNCLLPKRSQFADARTPPQPQGEGFDVGRFPHLSSCLLNQQKSPMGSKVFTIILIWCSGTGVLAFIGTHWKWFPARFSVSFWIFGGLFTSLEERVYASVTGITDITPWVVLVQVTFLSDTKDYIVGFFFVFLSVSCLLFVYTRKNVSAADFFLSSGLGCCYFYYAKCLLLRLCYCVDVCFKSVSVYCNFERTFRVDIAD